MSKFFINRPIVAIVISIIMVIVGVVTMVSLPVSQFPKVVPPEIFIQANYVGADAQTIEASVATPIEQQMSGVDNMNYMYSVNANNGLMRMFVNFDLATDPNIDHVLTQLRYATAEPQLPVDVRNYGVTVQKSLSAPFMILSLNSPKGTRGAEFLANYAYINLSDALLRVPGVSQCTVFGAGQYAIRIWVKPDQLAKLNITVPEIISAVNSQNTVNPAGKIGGLPVPKGQEFTYTVLAQGRLTTEEQFGNIVLRATPDGAIVRVRDVARVELSAADYDVQGRFNSKPSAVMALFPLPGANAVESARLVRKLMDEEKTRFPSDLDYSVPIDTTLSVTAGINEIAKTFWEALALVMLVVFIFLQGWRATLIPLAAVPVSLIGTFILFPALGFSINTLSLFGLVLAIGLVVDDAIVVVEAVEHHISEGMSPKEATLKAMEEVSGPVVAIALILAAVFLPTVFIPGITGRLYQQFAVTIALSVMISAFNALTLSPALSALLLRPATKSKGPLGVFFGGFNRAYGRLTDGYVGVCRALIHKSFFSVLLLVVVAAGAGLFGKKLPAGFLPEEDQGYLYVNIQLPYASSMERTIAACKHAEDLILSTPGVESCTTVAGFTLLSFTRNTYSSTIWVSLKDWDKRTKPEEQYGAIKAALNKKLSTIPEAVSFSFPPPAIAGVGTAGGFTMVLEDRAGKDVSFLAANVAKFMEAAKKRPEISSINTTFLPSVPQLYVDVDRDRVLKQGVELSDVYKTMQTFMGGFFVNYFNRFGRQWQVYVEAEGQYRTRAENMNLFYVRNHNNESIPMSALTSTRETSGPEFTMRYNLYRSAQLNGNAAPGYSGEQATRAMEEVFRETMPPEMGFDYIGMSFQEQKAAQGVPPAAIFGLSFLFVFLILAALYESWSLPFSVLLGTPIAVFGAFAALFCRQMVNNVYAQIGLVMLIGLAAKNAILIVEFARIEYENGKSIIDAALTGARIRLRPILMTSFAFILGSAPLWFATGSGAVSRRILGTVVIGGMLAATCIAVCLIPVTFYIVESLAARKTRMAVKLAPAAGLVVFCLFTAPLWSGCAVGPNYKRATIESPASYRSNPDMATNSFADLDWWSVYRDPVLQSLIREAFTNNYDLRIAVARIEQERALAAQARSAFFPSVGYSGAVSQGRNDLYGNPFPNNGASFGSAITTLNAFWEVDLWGRVRRLNEAARARFLASEEARRGIRISLLSDVASYYFRLLELDRELQIDAYTTNSFSDSVKIFTRRVEGGTSSALESSRAEAALADANSATPSVLEQIVITEDALCILLGRLPGPVPRGYTNFADMTPPEVPAGLPSLLLERRPDIREAEQLAHAANADVGESVAEFFPKIGLTAFLGRVSPELSAFTLGSANAWGVAADATGPIFEGGRLIGQYHQTKAARDEAVLHYRQTALFAFRDVSDALVSRQRLAEIRDQQAQEVASLATAVRLSTERYLAGKANYYEVLEAQQQLFPAQLSLARTERDQLLAVVALYKALGGGWQDEHVLPRRT
jgi:HAE1 family hydrophobic/amphiphilic exporter-1